MPIMTMIPIRIRMVSHSHVLSMYRITILVLYLFIGQCAIPLNRPNAVTASMVHTADAFPVLIIRDGFAIPSGSCDHGILPICLKTLLAIPHNGMGSSFPIAPGITEWECG